VLERSTSGAVSLHTRSHLYTSPHRNRCGRICIRLPYDARLGDFGRPNRAGRFAAASPGRGPISRTGCTAEDAQGNRACADPEGAVYTASAKPAEETMTSFVRLTILSTPSLLGMICTSPTEAQDATVRYVNTGAEGAEDGTSWEDAWTDLQTALGEVGEGVVIWVARGTYTPGTRRSDTFQLVNGVTIRGGFVGTEEVSFDLTRRDFAANETILSGEIGNIGPSDNVYHVVTSNDTDGTAILDGFTIAAGRASGLTDLDQDKGGGLLNLGGSPTIKNCIFHNNESGSWGGAVHNACGNPTLTNCIFADNRTTVSQGEHNKGGGMYSNCDQAILTSPTLINCLLVGNTAGIGTGGSGGAYYDDAQSASLLVNCTFVANHADYNGGGIYGSPTLANCILWNNSDRGGTDSSAQIFGSAIVTYSCVQGGWPGTGTTGDDPMFVRLPTRAGEPDAILGDLRLSSVSPCIDAGDNETAVRDVDVDLATVDTENYTAGPEALDQVMCLSCHRSHATAFPDIARWDMGATFVEHDSHPMTGDGGATADDIANKYYNYTFVSNQRSLCNKCHAKDAFDGPYVP